MGRIQKALLGVLLKRAIDGPLQRARKGPKAQTPTDLLDGRRRLGQDRVEHPHDVAALERSPTGQHVVDGSADRVEVATLVQCLPPALLRAHPLRGPHQRVGLSERPHRRRFVEQLGDTEVEELDLVGIVLQTLSHSIGA